MSRQESVHPSRPVTRPKVRCAACERKFVPTRRDSRYCSGACRQRAHRARAGIDDFDRRIDEAKRLYWSLIREKVEATGRSASQVLTDEAQFVDEEGDVFKGWPGGELEFIGKTAPRRPGWSSWGLEAAGPPFSPPTGALRNIVMAAIDRPKRRAV